MPMRSPNGMSTEEMATAKLVEHIRLRRRQMNLRFELAEMALRGDFESLRLIPGATAMIERMNRETRTSFEAKYAGAVLKALGTRYPNPLHISGIRDACAIPKADDRRLRNLMRRLEDRGKVRPAPKLRATYFALHAWSADDVNAAERELENEMGEDTRAIDALENDVGLDLDAVFDEDDAEDGAGTAAEPTDGEPLSADEIDRVPV